MRDALTVTGKMQQAEGQAKFMKDDSKIKSEEYLALKAKMEGASKSLLATIARIRKDQELRHREDGAENL